MSGHIRAVFPCSGLLRLAGPGLALGAAVLVAGCSNNVSRFDYPAFANNGSDTGLTTGSLNPVPAESVYPNGAPANSTAVVRQDLPPPSQQQQYAYAQPVQQAPLPPQPSYRTPPPYQPPVPQASYQPPAPVKPANKTISVQRGDTLSKISREHDVSVDDLKVANDLKSTMLSVGQEIVIPGTGGAVATANSKPVATYTVERGDSISKIARAQNISQDKLIEANDLKRPYRLSLGQKLTIPGAVIAKKSHEPIRVASRGANITLPSAKPEPGSSAAAPVAKTKVAARTENLPKPEPMAGNQFRWPVKGRIVSGFGPKETGKHNDGINVAVPKGTSIKSAENGVVAYAGSELQPYGNLVLIRHANNWVTAYAHNDELLVKRGDTVRRGQIIAKAGQSGSVSQPQLHFELRKGSKPVNPLSYMANSS